MEYRIVDIDNSYNLNAFNCDNPSINRYFQEDSYYNHICKLNRTKIVVDNDNIIAFYTIKMYNLRTKNDDYGRDIIPTYELQYLAVDSKYTCQGIGSELLKRIITNVEAYSQKIGGSYLIIHALNDKVDWYQNRGFSHIIDLNNENKDTTKALCWNLIDETKIDEYFEEEE